MKQLYARFVLWLIRPAVNAAIADSVKPGGQLWRFENHGGKALSSRHVVSVVKATGSLGEKTIRAESATELPVYETELSDRVTRAVRESIAASRRPS